MLLIKNAKLPTQEGFEIVDVLLDGERIQKIAKCIETQNCEVLDAQEAYILPGLVDLNVRLANDELNRDSLAKLTKTSLRGGVTTSVIMPDFSPRLDSSTLLDHFQTKASSEAVSLLVGAPLVSEDGEKLNNIATLLSHGAAAIWTTSSCNSNLLKRGFQYARMKLAPIFCACYDENLDDCGVMNEGEVSFELGLSGISKISESSAVAKIAEISTINNTKIIFQSLSSKRSIDIIKDMKKVNKNIYAEVSVHHLCKNDTACEGFDTYAKIMPPLREESERLELLNQLKLGRIDVLTCAHSPKSVIYKDVAFEEAAFGIGAIEEYLSICYTNLVKNAHISMYQLTQFCSYNPAGILNLNDIGKVAEGYRADLVLFDATFSKTVSDKTSLYDNDTLYGKVLHVIKDGKIAV